MTGDQRHGVFIFTTMAHPGTPENHMIHFCCGCIDLRNKFLCIPCDTNVKPYLQCVCCRNRSIAYKLSKLKVSDFNRSIQNYSTSNLSEGDKEVKNLHIGCGLLPISKRGLKRYVRSRFSWAPPSCLLGHLWQHEEAERPDVISDRVHVHLPTCRSCCF